MYFWNVLESKCFLKRFWLFCFTVVDDGSEPITVIMWSKLTNLCSTRQATRCRTAFIRNADSNRASESCCFRHKNTSGLKPIISIWIGHSVTVKPYREAVVAQLPERSLLTQKRRVRIQKRQNKEKEKKKREVAWPAKWVVVQPNVWLKNWKKCE